MRSLQESATSWGMRRMASFDQTDVDRVVGVYEASRKGRCKATLEGPRMHRGRLVGWRRFCKNKTKDESGYCWRHR